ncbi:MAG: TetR/AcrR family transcriptional regulator [Actinobacteria bacterium]|nr:TetR/AcrR family transcriptional regulator [Actinomycetota bacterium]
MARARTSRRSSGNPTPRARIAARPKAVPARPATGRGDAPGSAATKGEQTRHAILRAAIARFGREGFRSTSVADIARDAGVGGTVAYAYFPNKEALFLAAVDEDAAAVINEGLAALDVAGAGWGERLVFTLLEAVERHPMARRLLSGLEPDVTTRVLEIPALAELRKACAELIRAQQVSGAVRDDIDATQIANGIVAIMLSLLMSLVQFGREAALTYGADVTAVFDAALDPPADRATRRARS